MGTIWRQKLWLASSSLLSVIVLWIHLDDVGASEFSGGWLTGPLFKMADGGAILLLMVLLFAFFFPRIGSFVALAGAVLCMPFYLYFLCPGPFRRVFKGEYSVPLHASFVWNTWAAVGVASLLLTIVLSIQCLVGANPTSVVKPESTETP